MEEDTGKLFKRIEDREKELSDRRSRMDTDADLAKKKEFTLEDDKGNKIPNAKHVTLPKAALFASRANFLLSSSNPQIIVEGNKNGEKMDDQETTLVEEFLTDIYESADEYLNQKGKIALFNFQSFHANMRGGLAGLIYLQEAEKGDRLLPDIRPWDTRFVASELEPDGKGYSSFLSTRSKADIEKDFGEDAVKRVTKSAAEIRDVWTPEKELVFLGKEKIAEEENPWGFVPVVEQISPAGLHFTDADKEKFEGESIFWLIRDIAKWLNTCASIAVSLNSEALHPPYQREMPTGAAEGGAGGVVGEGTEKPDYPGEPRSVTDTEAAYQLVPKRDLMNSNRFTWAILDSMWQQCSFATTEFGTLTFPLSQVALQDLSDKQHLVLWPGLETLARWYRAVGRMLMRQFVMLGKTSTFGVIGNEHEYNPKDLDLDVSISYKFFHSSRRDRTARLAEMRQSLDLPFSDHYRLAKIGEVENPEGVLVEARAERAEKLDPVILLYRQVHALIDQDRQVEAKITFRKLKRVLMGQDMLPEVENPKAPPTGPGEEIPVFGGAGANKSPLELEGEQGLGEGLEEARREASK